MDWNLVAGLKKTLAAEVGAQVYPPGQRTPLAFLYPNTYNLGMSNLGLQILYQIINGLGNFGCERFFLPSDHDQSIYRKSGTPLLSVETQQPLQNFSYICVMMSFEMDYLNFLTMLDLGRMPLLAAERKESDPLVIMGGPCATFNPEPLTLFVDIFVIGEGEETLPCLLQLLQQGKERGRSRKELLLEAAQLPGIYVPRFYTPSYLEQKDGTRSFQNLTHDERVPAVIDRQWVHDLDQYPHTSAILTPSTEFANMFIVEVARGCGRHCRFCMAGYCFRKPRNRNLEKLWQDIKQRPAATAKVGLMGAAVSDYPDMDVLTQRLTKEQVPFTVASLRADTLTLALAQALSISGQRTMTVAPEAGSIRMREAINKGITEANVLRAVKVGAASGMPHIKLYFMIGLPGEQDEDVDAIINLVHKVRTLMDSQGHKGSLIVSVNAFVPKPFTPYQWEPLADNKILKKRYKKLTEAFRQDRRLRLSLESLKETEMQAVLAKGSRLVGQALYYSFKEGIPFKQALSKTGLDFKTYAHQRWQRETPLPWHHLHMGFSEQYLWEERARSVVGTATVRCFDGCRRCGVCSS